MAAGFDGVSQHISLNASMVGSTFPITMFVWANALDFSPATPQTLFALTQTTGINNYYALTMQNGGASGPYPQGQFFNFSTLFATQVASPWVPTGTWFYAAVSVNGSNLWAYNNFQVAAIAQTKFAPSVNSYVVGSHHGSTNNNFSQFFHGYLAHAAFWNVLLTRNEIEAMGNGTPPSQIRKNNLLLYLPIYGSSGGAATTDLSGNLRNGAATALSVAPTDPPVDRYSPIFVSNYGPGQAPLPLHNLQTIQTGALTEFAGDRLRTVQSGLASEYVSAGRNLQATQSGLLIEYATPSPGPNPTPVGTSGLSLGSGASSGHGIGFSLPGGGFAIRFGHGYGIVQKE